MASLLSIVQGACLRCNYPQPASAFSSADPNIQLMVACVQDAGDDAMERADWSSLKMQSPMTFTGDGVTAMWPLPVGFQRLSPSDTFVSSIYPTLRLPGPVNEDDLLRMKALPMSIATHVWRQVGNAGINSTTGDNQQNIEFYPVLVLGEVVSYVYAQKVWITNSTGAQYNSNSFQADTDLTLLPGRLIRLGAIWRWKRRKNFDYSEEMSDYEGALDRLSGGEDTGRVIDMSDSLGPIDTWPGTIIDNTNDVY